MAKRAVKTDDSTSTSDVQIRAHDAGPMTARRTHQRFDVELEVSLESDSNFYMGFSENLSEGGLFIATHLVKPMGAELHITFKLPHREAPVRIKGLVRWVREYSETSDTPPGMGVRFEGIAEADVLLIREFLAARAPLFFDDE